jgi:hypothetical protein
LQLLGAVFTSVLFALGLTMGIFGDFVAKEPSVVQMIMAVPAAIMHPNFLYVWGAILAFGGLVLVGSYVFNAFKKR